MGCVAPGGWGWGGGRTAVSGELLRIRQWTIGFHKMYGISWLRICYSLMASVPWSWHSHPLSLQCYTNVEYSLTLIYYMRVTGNTPGHDFPDEDTMHYSITWIIAVRRTTCYWNSGRIWFVPHHVASVVKSNLVKKLMGIRHQPTATQLWQQAYPSRVLPFNEKH
jgi:hypothetical protein